MATVIRMPQFTETMVEGVVGKWLKKEGDWVAKEELLVEIVTDKVVVEMPSLVEGRLVRIITPQDAVVEVGGEMAVLEEVAGQAAPPAQMPAVEVRGAPLPEKERAVPEETRGYSPVVRRLAQQYGVDLKKVQGTGLGGRVTREDVIAYVERLGLAPEHKVPLAPKEEEEVVPITPIRRLIADHMVRSVQTSPHAWGAVEVDVTNLVRLREGLKEEFQRRVGVPLTYLPFVIRAVVEALKEHPFLNSKWSGDHIVVKKRINIGIPTAIEEGLVVPVIKDADSKSVTELAKELARLTTGARERKLSLEDVQGGTFTVNNTGVLGTVFSMSIIHQPQAAILNTDAIVKRPVVIDDAIAIRSMMNLSLSFDHRILDGAIAVRFLQRVKALLESYGPGLAIE